MAEHKNMKEYHGQIQEALDDKFLRATLDKFAVDYKANRARIFEGWDVPELINDVANIKDNAAQHMMELFEQFKAEAEKRGLFITSRIIAGLDPSVEWFAHLTATGRDKLRNYTTVDGRKV